MNDFDSIPDHGLGWLEASGEHADIVLSTRVRLARNLQGHAFGPRARVNDREAVLRQFKQSLDRSETLRTGTLLEIEGVRVVDCSIVPNIVTGNTNAAAIATAWRASELVLQDAVRA